MKTSSSDYVFKKAGYQTLIREVPFRTPRVVDVVVVATGSMPNIEALNPENAGVEYGKEGILVNNELKTTADNIYACGDVIGKYLFTQAAHPFTPGLRSIT